MKQVIYQNKRENNLAEKRVDMFKTVAAPFVSVHLQNCNSQCKKLKTLSKGRNVGLDETFFGAFLYLLLR